MPRLRSLALAMPSAGVLLWSSPNGPISFRSDVAPILEKNCVACHGPDRQMSQLNLSSRAAVLKGGQKGPALFPGNAVASLLYRRVTGQDQPQMPLGGKLSPAEIATIEKWIDEGAPWDDAAVSTAAPTTPSPSREKVFSEQDYNWWALRRPVRPPVPQASDSRQIGRAHV